MPRPIKTAKHKKRKKITKKRLQVVREALGAETDGVITFSDPQSNLRYKYACESVDEEVTKSSERARL